MSKSVCETATPRVTSSQVLIVFLFNCELELQGVVAGGEEEVGGPSQQTPLLVVVPPPQPAAEPTPLLVVVDPPQAAAVEEPTPWFNISAAARAGPSQPVAGTSLVYCEEYHKLLKRKASLEKKREAKLNPVLRAKLHAARRKREIGQFNMPDAPPPPPRSRRKVSPERVVPCPLLPGTPAVPPPRVPQRWELQTLTLDTSGPSRVDVEGAAATLPPPPPPPPREATPPPPQEFQPLILTPSTGVVVVAEGYEIDESLIVDADFELVGMSPSTSSSAVHSGPTLQHLSPGPSTSSARLEPLMCESDLDDEILQWERSAGLLNPGSDAEEEEDCPDPQPRRRHAVDQLILTCTDYTFPASSAVMMVLAMLVERILLQPEIQDKIHEEIDRVVGRGRLPTLDDRKNMHYLEACIRETMRFDTTVPLAVPHRAMKTTTIAGYDVPEGTMISANLVMLHMDKEIWGDPENFRPERFLRNGELDVSLDKSLPFGAGRRLCAGETYSRQTMFQVFSAFMQAFKVSTADGKPLLKPAPRIQGIITTLPEFWVKINVRV